MEKSYVDFRVPTVAPKRPLPLRAILDINYCRAELLEERGPGGSSLVDAGHTKPSGVMII